MNTFTIENFAKECKQAMANIANPADRREAAQQYLQKTLDENDLAYIVETLEDAIPEGADVGEMIVHHSPELTMMYARVPGKFQSGIHNHTVFACIGQLTGSETSKVYSKTVDGKLEISEALTSNVGEVISLEEDAIHHIENPHQNISSSLHIYGGDFYAIMDERSLWSYDDHEETPFSFQGLIQESIKGMKLNNNDTGLHEIVKAIPSTKALVDA